jgi:hypothetical protein
MFGIGMELIGGEEPVVGRARDENDLVHSSTQSQRIGGRAKHTDTLAVPDYSEQL